MKISDFKKFEKIDTSQIKGQKSLLEVMDEECNTLLKTRKGLQYLMLRYPDESLVSAINQFKGQYFLANSI